jgi:hypothetical protein
MGVGGALGFGCFLMQGVWPLCAEGIGTVHNERKPFSQSGPSHDHPHFFFGIFASCAQ